MHARRVLRAEERTAANDERVGELQAAEVGHAEVGTLCDLAVH